MAKRRPSNRRGTQSLVPRGPSAQERARIKRVASGAEEPSEKDLEQAFALLPPLPGAGGPTPPGAQAPGDPGWDDDDAHRPGGSEPALEDAPEPEEGDMFKVTPLPGDVRAALENPPPPKITQEQWDSSDIGEGGDLEQDSVPAILQQMLDEQRQTTEAVRDLMRGET